MSNDQEKRERQFLIGLAKLTRETGIEIAGCGCCGSPVLSDAQITSDESGYSYSSSENVSWIDPSDSYDWENFASSIVRGEANGGLIGNG